MADDRGHGSAAPRQVRQRTDTRHHPGELEIDDGHYDWPDHDEDCHGRIDSNALRREYPENYTWSCCGKPGDDRGCKRGEGPSIDEKNATSEEEDPSDEEEGEMHHPGELEVDWESDVWADHDEDCHGEIDTETNQRDVPEGSVWSCCGEAGNAEGCEEP